ncbi:hypothetical protein LTR36_008534 [Oleoguttula mirabilis]|uniref:Uncharacterized protein n=1 Tax=Oleoguttula mirabilis TaxID=1507867 RepID=A0AAV9JSU6_9PEZI|nr:hypothetical protein LTR36_008534 [Oleoguttula mirabilis]
MKLVLGMLSATALAAPVPSAATPMTGISLASAIVDLQGAVAAILSAYYSEEGMISRTVAASSERTAVQTFGVTSTAEASTAAPTQDLRDVVDTKLAAVYGKQGVGPGMPTASPQPSIVTTTSAAAKEVHDVINAMQLQEDDFVRVAGDGVARSYAGSGKVVDYRKLTNSQLLATFDSLPPSLQGEEGHYRDIYQHVDGNDVAVESQLWDPLSQLQPLELPHSPLTPRPHDDNRADRAT